MPKPKKALAKNRENAWVVILIWVFSYVFAHFTVQPNFEMVPNLMFGVIFASIIQYAGFALGGRYFLGRSSQTGPSKGRIDLAWVLMTLFGVGIGWWVSLLLGDSLVIYFVYQLNLAYVDTPVFYTIFLLSGFFLVVAGAQWLVLRGKFKNAILWIPITLFAGLSAIVLSYVLVPGGPNLFLSTRKDLTYQLIFGAITGLGMFWLLRSTNEPPNKS